MVTISAQDALRWAIEIETNGKAFYESAAARATDRDVRLLFADLAQQEERHRRTFLYLLEKAPATAALADQDRREAESYLSTLYDQALFGGKDRGMALATQATDEPSAVRAAIAFEKDTLLFFREVHECVGVAQRGTLVAIMDEEQKHLRQLGHVLRGLPWVL